jgi:AbrB family looped-hinge helix DNA binding protein
MEENVGMKLIAQNVMRKVDNLGRVVLPKGLRDQYGINDGDELDVFVLQDGNGEYICFKAKGVNVDPKYVAAVEVLQELGCKIPEELNEKFTS